MENAAIISKIQLHLFNHPIFRWSESEEKTMNVLVVGDTDYAKAFIDLCFETGQMTTHTLNVYWCLKDESTAENYLGGRPEFLNFISVDGKWDNEQYPPYGYLYLKKYENYMDEISDKARYAFIADEDDENNEEIADLFKNAVKNNCLAAFLHDGEICLSTNEESQTESKEAMYANNLISDREELERMAFNTHRIWEGSGNLDYEKAKLRFKDEYNHNASVSFVMSIPYKLHSIGVTDSNPYDAARRLEEIVAISKKNPNSPEAAVISELAALEHRRWVIEKICEGTRRLVDKNGMPEYASCIARSSVKKKDDLGRVLMHPCIVHGTSKTPLSGDYYSDHYNWDNRSEQDAELDDLDKMSIDLHRAMKRAADQVRNDRGGVDDAVEILRKLCQNGSDILRRDFDRYYFCIENIIDRSKPYSYQFETYEKMLFRSFGELEEADVAEAKKQVDKLRKILFPLIESNQYRDYKKYDAELIEHIPFILTGVYDVHICIPLGLISGKNVNNSDFFISVASVTALYATEITYLYVDEPGSNLDILKTKVKAINNYFEYRGRSVNVHLTAFVFNDERENLLTDVLNGAKNDSHIRGYSVKKCNKGDGFVQKIIECMDETRPDFFDGSGVLTSSELVNSQVISDVVKRVPYFEFDSYNKAFRNMVNCEYLEYTRLSSFIQVEDMFALMNAQDKEFNYQDCAEIYKGMWEIYCGNAIRENDFPLCAICWTRVCNILKTGGTGNMQITNVPIGATDQNELRIIKKMLQELERGHYLKNLQISKKNNVTVRIPRADVKRMYSKAGDLLEAYVYFEACKLGWFDDVQTGYKFRWEYDDVTNELDCVLTKDYRSILVECKSTRTPDEGFYLTLDSLADHFGIGYKKVLIMVTDTNKTSYDNYVSRGKQLDIITISKKSDLMQIGEKLREIMLES